MIFTARRHARAVCLCLPEGDVFVYLQDNAPAHRAHDTVELLRCETPQFISPIMWPANSRDLNAVDYCICDMMQERVYHVPIRDTDELWQRLVETRTEFQHSEVDDAIVSGEKDWKRARRWWSLVTLNTLCDAACLAFRLPHNTTGSFHSHQ